MYFIFDVEIVIYRINGEVLECMTPCKYVTACTPRRFARNVAFCLLPVGVATVRGTLANAVRFGDTVSRANVHTRIVGSRG